MNSPGSVYRTLLRSYGPRGWWPVISPRGSTPAYHPRRYSSPGPKSVFEICVGAILTQNTAWSNVVTALERLKQANALDAQKIINLASGRMQTLIRSSGYYVEKTKKLKAFSRFSLGCSPGLSRWLRQTPLKQAREELLKVYGVGPETADSMLLYAGGRRIFVVDAYTRRIGGRLGWFPEKTGYCAVQEYLTAKSPRSIRAYQEYHALFVELGKRSCRSTPLCKGCPLEKDCSCARRRI